MAEYKCYVSKHALLLSVDFHFPLEPLLSHPKRQSALTAKNGATSKEEMERGLSHSCLIHAKNFTQIAMKIQEKQKKNNNSTKKW